MAVNANEGAFSPTLNNPAARTRWAARTGASNAQRTRIIRFIAASISSEVLSEAPINPTQHFLTRYPTMQIFSWAMAQSGGAARCPPCSQNAHDETVLVRCAQLMATLAAPPKKRMEGIRKCSIGIKRVLVLLGGGFEEAQLPFLSAGQWNGIAFCEARIAVLARCAGRNIQHAVEAQIGETVGRDVLPNLFSGVAGRDEFLSGRRVDAVETGRDDRRRADAHMHFFGSRIAKHLHNFTACRASYQRIIDDNDPFPLQHLRHCIELDLDTEVADRLFRLNEGAADIVISNQPQFKWNPRPLGIAERSRHPGVRYGNDDIRRHRRFLRQLPAQRFARGIDRVRTENFTVRP